MKKYYEIVRFANTWPDMGEYEDVDRMVKRGWLKKAIRYMSEWDFGQENIDAAICYGHVRDTAVDKASIGDKVICEDKGRYLCEAHCKSGLYDAYYLVGELPEKYQKTARNRQRTPEGVL